MATTQCMAFIPQGTPLKHIPMAWLSGMSLSFVGSYKYLGFMLALTLSDELHVKVLSRSLCCRANLLIGKFGSCDPSIKCFLFRAYCTLLYGLAFVQSLSVMCENSLRVLYNNSLWWLLNLLLNCSVSGIFVGGGLPSFPELRRKSSLSIQTRILALDNLLILVLPEPLFCLSLPLWITWSSVICTQQF